jgi:type I restriction enzyme S subunit
MKEGWEYKRLKEVANFISGYTPNKEEISNEGKYPYFKVAEMNIAGNELYMKKTSLFVNSPKKIFPKGSIIFPKNGGAIYTEKKRILEVDSVIDLNTEAIYPTAQVELMYLYFLLTFTKISSFDKGGGLPSLDLKKMSESIIPVPPLSEQQSIVNYLDSAFAKIDAMKANAEKSLNEAKALFQASLKEMLEPKEGTRWSTIGDLFETYSGGTPTKSNKEYYEGGTIPWLRSGEVCQKEIKETEMFITEKGLKESSAKYYPENTVVVAMYGATAAQVGILRIKATSNQAVCGILPHKDFLPEFVYYWFSSIEDKLAAQAQGGAQPNISQQKIKKVEIPIYSITEQQSIVVTLDSLKSKVDRLQENYDKISQECDALKQAILRKIFE